ncbi:DUF262 domain-containing protein [uncultured Bacteroides sp.]|uniref:DUF262 domain-containing protein n=1 Tax=uncultured Bacteroides sp. TaxID=162156 RepID=UPI002AAA91E6|nr:DUF262 domain-containing protein [uncultured Bacteroides sp.]
MANSQLIYNIKEVFTDYLKEKYKFYNIPEYQRGYKWTPQQVEQLLDDIDRFHQNGNDDRFYCVQNITLVEKDAHYNVVDGQQRLTTLIILLSHLGETRMVENKIKYSVRPDTDYFIKNFIINPNISTDNWDVFLKNNMDKDYDHQDIFYLFSAHNTIRRWITSNKIDTDSFKDKLLYNVRLIVNKPNIDSEQELFMNLNTGKVSLDGADLVRALLITNVAKEELKNADLEDTKSIVRINERRVRIGLELDEISAWWNQPNVREYFNFLSKISVPTNETIDFNSDIYPIDLLYKLHVAKDGKKQIRLRDFENSEYIELYKKITSLHRTIKDWYQDYEIYHFVKYIVTQTSTTIATIWDDWKNTTSRQGFIEKLKDKSKLIIDAFVDEIDDFNEDWFANEDSRLYKILIMSDIIKIIESQHSENKIPFLPADYFRPKKEDIEHIFPQTPIGTKNKEEQSDFIAYIGLLNDLSDIYNENKNEENKIDISMDCSNSVDMETCKENINRYANKLIHRNSIGNLVLLNEKINRGYGNDFYTKKRIEIIRNPKKEFIRPHTLNPFIKGFLSTPSDLEIWTEKDIKANAKYIKEQLKVFFNIKEVNHEQV